MTWDDIGFLLSKNKYSENSLISELYTMNHGKVTGIIFGGTSKKIRNYLQIGNKLHVNYNSKSENRIGYFKIEIDQALSPFYFDNHQKLLCITASMNLIKLLNADLQKNIIVYQLIEKLYLIIESNNWIKKYIFWELELFKTLGYDLDLVSLVDKKVVNGESLYTTKSLNEKKLVPSFLINENEDIEDLPNLLSGLKLLGDYLDKTILKPNNLTQPTSRLQFINSLK